MTTTTPARSTDSDFTDPIVRRLLELTTGLATQVQFDGFLARDYGMSLGNLRRAEFPDSSFVDFGLAWETVKLHRIRREV